MTPTEPVRLDDDALLALKDDLSDESERVKDHPDADEDVRVRIWAVDAELERRGLLGPGGTD